MVREPLTEEEYRAIFSKVPRLSVEVVIVGASGAILLSRREAGPCRGLWHIPGGTVRFGEPLTEAVVRVAEGELGLEVHVGPMIGYIEYPSHLALQDWPVGIAFRSTLSSPEAAQAVSRPGAVEWFRECPGSMHDEQKAFLIEHALAS